MSLTLAVLVLWGGVGDGGDAPVVEGPSAASAVASVTSRIRLIEDELAQLARDVPSAAGPTVLAVTGGVIAAASVVFTVASAFLVLLGVAPTYFFLGLVLVAVHVAVMVAGFVWLGSVVGRRLQNAERRKKLEAELEALRALPPPVPLPPPSVRGPVPSLVLARF